MAAPNIVNVTTIIGKSAGVALTTSVQTIVSNTASSGKVVKVNMIQVSNIDGVSPADVTVELVKGGTTAFKIVNTVSVPQDAALVVIAKDNSVYLEEGDLIRGSASADGDLHAICSYEEIS